MRAFNLQLATSKSEKDMAGLSSLQFWTLHAANGKRALRDNRTSDFAVCFLIALRRCRLLGWSIPKRINHRGAEGPEKNIRGSIFARLFVSVPAVYRW
jgi:hypothetical protein